MVKRWKVIVEDQLNTLHECGLGNAASEYIVSYSGGKYSDFQEMADFYDLFPPEATTVVESFKKPWEVPAVNQIYHHCMAKEQQTTNQTDIVFYFHNKGAGKMPSQPGKTSQTYKNITHWRKYMEYFLLERPALCMEKLLNDSKTSCGINWKYNHYSGNMWAANCQYIRTLEPLNMSGHLNYVAAETWIGDDKKRPGRKPAILHSTKMSLYKNTMLPSMYGDYDIRVI